MINNNNASEFPSSTPYEEENPEPYSLIVIVSSGKIQLQHKASCYRGHGYSNRLNPCRGALLFSLHARISRVAGTLLGNAPSRLSDTTQPILGSTERPSAGLYPMRQGV